MTTTSGGERQYLNLLEQALNGEPFPEGERTGNGRRGVWQRSMTFNFADGFPLITTRYVPFRWVVEELLWYMAGSTNVRDLQKVNVDIWDEWATPEKCAEFGRAVGDLGPVYHHQWTNFGASRSTDNPHGYWSNKNMRWVNQGYADDGFNQVKALVEGIKNSPASTRHILTAWNPAEAAEVHIPQCTTFFHVKVHNQKELSGCLYQRSADMFLGVPFNIASYALFTMLIARATGYEPRSFTHLIGDAHVYDNQVDVVEQQLKRTPLPSPTVSIKLEQGCGYAPLNVLLSGDIRLHGYQHCGKLTSEVAV